ncbi:MAG: hypothetical protein AB1Z29_22925 [Desulfobacterales bacterium]|jgi:hypothetical protein
MTKDEKGKMEGGRIEIEKVGVRDDGRGKMDEKMKAHISSPLFQAQRSSIFHRFSRNDLNELSVYPVSRIQYPASRIEHRIPI